MYHHDIALDRLQRAATFLNQIGGATKRNRKVRDLKGK